MVARGHARRRTLWVAAWLLTSACQHEPAPASAFGPADELPPGLVLPAVELGADARADHATLGELWRSLAAVEGEPAAAAALLTLAARQDDASLKERPGARRLAIEAVVRTVQAGALSQRFEELRGVVDRLYRTAPSAAETRFALAYLRWILVSDGAGGVRRGDVDASVIRDLEQQLSTLLREQPDFRGPAEFDADRLRRELIAVRALLPAAATPAAAP